MQECSAVYLNSDYLISDSEGGIFSLQSDRGWEKRGGEGRAGEEGGSKKKGEDLLGVTCNTALPLTCVLSLQANCLQLA